MMVAAKRNGKRDCDKQVSDVGHCDVFARSERLSIIDYSPGTDKRHVPC